MAADTNRSSNEAVQEDNQSTVYEYEFSTSESMSEQDGEGGTGGQEGDDGEDDPEPPPETTNETSASASAAVRVCARCGAEILGATSYMQWTTALVPNRLIPQQMCCSQICAGHYCITYIAQHVNEIRDSIGHRDPMVIIERMRTTYNERIRQ